MLHLLPDELLREIGSYLERPVLLSGDFASDAGMSRVRVVSRLIDLETLQVSVSDPALHKPSRLTQFWSDASHEVAVRKRPGARLHVMSNGDRVTVEMHSPATQCVVMVEKPNGIILGPFALSADQVLDVFFACVVPLDTNESHIVLATFSSSLTPLCNIVAFHLESGRLHDLTHRIRNNHNSSSLTILTTSIKWTGTLWRCALLCSEPDTLRRRFVVRVLDFTLETLPDNLSLVRFLSTHRTFVSRVDLPIVDLNKSQGIAFDTAHDNTIKILIHYTVGASSTKLHTVISVLSLNPNLHRSPVGISSCAIECTNFVDGVLCLGILPVYSSLTVVDKRTLVFVGSSGGVLLIREGLRKPAAAEQAGLCDTSAGSPPIHSPLKITPLADGYRTFPRNICLRHRVLWREDPNFAEFVASTHSCGIYYASPASPAASGAVSGSPAAASPSAADLSAALGLVMLGCMSGDRCTTNMNDRAALTM